MNNGCFQVLAVLDVIMPGESRMRGVMLYELHLPNVMLGNRWRVDDDNRGGGADGGDAEGDLEAELLPGCYRQDQAAVPTPRRSRRG